MLMSGSSFLLDTNIVIDFFGNDQKIRSEMERLAIVSIPLIVLAELYAGAFSSNRQEKNIRQINEFVKDCKIILPDEETAFVFGKIRADLKLKGKPIPENDIWIAAIAIQHNLTLISRDKHFSEVKKLEVLSW